MLSGSKKKAATRIRSRARAYTNTDKPCVNCSYDKHVEVCHIKNVADFPLTSTLNEINSSENLILLCRNCHWEFDNGMLRL
jgi:hypothetical protein